MAGRFIKGQTVFQACIYFASTPNYEVVERRVVSRTVDSCGKKFVTFEDHGYDSVYGRRDYADSAMLHETADAAFRFLEQYPTLRGTKKVIIYPNVVSDREWIEQSF